MVKYLVAKEQGSSLVYVHNCRGKSPVHTHSAISAKDFASTHDAARFMEQNGLGEDYFVEKLETGRDARNDR